MPEQQHTPGPWIQDEGNPLCIGTPKPWYPRQVYHIVATLEGGKEYTADSNATAEANARLIAAAPDLLEALQRLMARRPFVPHCHEHADQPCVDCRARAAIAKATISMST